MSSLCSLSFLCLFGVHAHDDIVFWQGLVLCYCGTLYTIGLLKLSEIKFWRNIFVIVLYKQPQNYMIEVTNLISWVHDMNNLKFALTTLPHKLHNSFLIRGILKDFFHAYSYVKIGPFPNSGHSKTRWL